MATRGTKGAGAGGTTRKKRGKSASQAKRVEFAIEAPQASEVAVTGTFCEWKDAYAMEQGERGQWKRELELPPGRYEYRFLVDGEWRDDPGCDRKVPNPYGGVNCILEVQ